MHLRPRLLYIDAYDSFANNIISLLITSCHVEVECVKHDDPRFWPNNLDAFAHYLDAFDAVVAGPGPGNPNHDADIGLAKTLWSLPVHRHLPVLGICLGFQSLCLAFGAQVKRLNEPRHGLVRPVLHTGRDIFRDAGDNLQATCYHSLNVVLDASRLNCHHESENTFVQSSPSSRLLPLAWDVEDRVNHDVLLAARHRTFPFWGVQYHPESICTTPGGAAVVLSWWCHASAWNQAHRRMPRRPQSPRNLDVNRSPSLSQDHNDVKALSLAVAHVKRITQSYPTAIPPSRTVCWDSRYLASLKRNIIPFCEATQMHFQKSLAILHSSVLPNQPVVQELGRYTIISLPSKNEMIHVRYSVKSQSVYIFLDPPHSTSTSTSTSTAIGPHELPNFWPYIKTFLSLLCFERGSPDSPFWGGFMGYVSYEAGLETMSIDNITTMNGLTSHPLQRPDIHFLLVERSLVFDNTTGCLYAQSLRDEPQWCKNILDFAENFQPPQSVAPIPLSTSSGPITQPKHSICLSPSSHIDYTQKIRLCDDSIRAGQSYELCLTNSIQVYTKAPSLTESRPDSAWALFRKLQSTNPAPFSSYLSLYGERDALKIVSSSPERFLKWSRDDLCQFRPIKGTVKKTLGVTYQDACDILNSSKERAENLMIVDLIRHDLHGVVGAGNVSAPKIMQIEEYATVYQLVSVIQGRGLSPLLAPDSGSWRRDKSMTNDSVTGASGIDVLANSLPPGSMTGAPKKRSCELLQGIEQRKSRGVYSGVIGYLDVGGAGDFSVVIRTAFKWESDTVTHSHRSAVPDSQTDRGTPETTWERWTIGAGGAITAQSDVDLEYQEMLTKLNSVMGAFDIELVSPTDEMMTLGKHDTHQSHEGGSEGPVLVQNDIWCKHSPF